MLYIGQASGEFIHLTDSAKASCKIDIKENVKQETRSGKNLWNDTSIENKKVSELTNTQISMSDLKLEAGDYRFKLFFTDGTYAQADVNVLLKNSENATLKIISINSYATLTEEEAEQIVSGVCFTNATGLANYANKTITGLMLTKGTTAVDKYEKYGASPSLDYPAPIQTVKDSVKVTSTNKNLFNKENIEYYNNNSSAFESATNDVPTRLRTNSFELKPNDYILSGIPDNIQLIAVRAYNNKKEYIEGGAVRDNNKFTLKDNVEYVHFLFSKIDGSNINTDEISNADLMLEVGSDVTPYIEHKSQSVTVSIQQEMLTKDYLDKTNKKEVHFWDKLKVKDKISRIIKRQAENRTSFNYTVENVKPNTWTVIKNNAICNRFVQVSPYIVEKSNCFSVWNGDNVITITIDNSYLKDVSSDEKILESWNELLNKWESEGEPLELFYERQDSKEINLTQEQIEALEKLDEMQTYKNITNITTDSIAILDVDYKKDLETWQKQQDDRITALEELLSTTQTSAMLVENLENDLLKEVE